MLQCGGCCFGLCLLWVCLWFAPQEESVSLVVEEVCALYLAGFSADGADLYSE